MRGPRQAAPQEQQWVPDQEPRTWWAPILIVVAILVLLGLIGLGLWLAMRGQPTPAPSASASPTSSASPSPSPTPSQTTPSASPPAILVAVPPVRGLSVSDAQTILQSQGLNSKVVTQVSDLPPGTVIDTNPAASTQVPAGTEVTLFVATPPPSPSSPAQS